MHNRQPSSGGRWGSEPSSARGSRLASLLLAAIRAYQLVLRPVLPPTCRFAPSCSEYARDAIRAHGPARGLLLAARRIARCHPGHPGGYDPVRTADA